MKRISLAILLMSYVLSARGQVVSGVCMVSVPRDSDRADAMSELVLRQENCVEGHRCNSTESSNVSWSRWTGIAPSSLKQEGAQLEARMTGDAGELRCTGSVHDGVLAGRYTFTPNASFVQSMRTMGFADLTSPKLEGFLMLDVGLDWVHAIKNAGVTDLTTDHLMALRALGVAPEFIRAMADAGYPELRAEKLIEMKAVGVTPEKAKEARALGFQPSEQELVEMSIFKIDRPFVERMRARGLTNLTVAKLIQVKIFKLDE